jgi:Prp31 C terminal domain
MRKAANRMNFDFNVAEDEYIDGDEVVGLGTINKEGSGRLRLVASQQKARRHIIRYITQLRESNTACLPTTPPPPFGASGVPHSASGCLTSVACDTHSPPCTFFTRVCLSNCLSDCPYTFLPSGLPPAHRSSSTPSRRRSTKPGWLAAALPPAA